MRRNIFCKGIVIIIVLVMLGNTFVVSSEIKHNEETQSTLNDDITEIRIAIYSLFGNSLSSIQSILEGYQWIVGNKTYKMIPIMLTDNDIFNGELTVENFDLLAMPYGDTTFSMLLHFYPSIRNMKWKSKITDYVKSGGGFVGYCAPTLIATDFYETPKTLLGWVLNHFNLGISGAKLIFDSGIPFLSQLSGKPEKILDKIVEGKLKKFYSESCLLEQAFVKNPDLTIQDIVNEMIAKTGEKIVVKRFVRFQLGQSDD